MNKKHVQEGHEQVQQALLDYTLTCYPSIPVSREKETREEGGRAATNENSFTGQIQQASSSITGDPRGREQGRRSSVPEALQRWCAHADLIDGDAARQEKMKSEPRTARPGRHRCWTR